MRHLALLFLATVTVFAVPSQRDALITAKRAAQQAYTAAQRAKDKSQFIAAAAGFQEVGQKVAAANRALISKINSNGYRKAEQDQLKPLNASLEGLSGFIQPTELTPESIRSVDRYIREIDQAIDVHHAASLNIR
jgi:hypothetical protein